MISWKYKGESYTDRLSSLIVFNYSVLLYFVKDYHKVDMMCSFPKWISLTYQSWRNHQLLARLVLLVMFLGNENNLVLTDW